MDYRKLIKFGHSAYVVSMPAKWLKRNTLSKGDTLFLEEIGNHIILSTEKEEKTLERVETIEVKEQDNYASIARKLISAYEDNATTIIFSGKQLYKKARDISELTKLFTALEIIEHTKERIICKIFIDTTAIDIISFIRRMDNGIKSIMKDLSEQLQEQKELAQFRDDMREREKSTDKITRLLRRVIKERLYKQEQKKENALTLLRYWQSIVYIEEMGDVLEEMALAPMEDYSSQERKQAKTFLNQSLTLFEKTMSAFYTKDAIKAHLLADKINAIQEKIELELKQEQHSILLHELSQSIYLIHEINKVNY